jgi:hypothetical protein
MTLLLEHVEILDSEQFDGRAQNVCGYLPFVDRKLLVPESLTRIVSYGSEFPSLEVDLIFFHGRYEVKNLNVLGGKAAVSSHFLTRLALPKLIRQIAVSAIKDSAYWTTDRPSGMIDPAEIDDYLVQLYWFEHLSWGKPRRAVMEHMFWSRSSANYHLRRIAKSYYLPGPHSA